MDLPTLTTSFPTTETLRRSYEEQFSRGGAVVLSPTALRVGARCRLVLVHPDDRAQWSAAARVVALAPGSGVAVEFLDFGDAERAALRAFVESGGPAPADPLPAAEPASPPVAEPEAPEEGAVEEDQQGDGASGPPVGDRLQLRLRGLSPAEQLKLARGGSLQERTALERIYGKHVWETLLRNPRITQPEVGRIARMGALPVPLLDSIVANPSWLRSGLVRRALLTNPRLKGMSLTKVLRACPKAELKQIPIQTAYPMAVREAARKMLKKGR
jgi:hypothetical protein